MPRLPNVSILFKLYAIIALFATVTVMLAVVAIDSARRQTKLTSDFDAALQGAQNVERMNTLIYAVTLESRGIYLARDAAAVSDFTGRMMRFNEELLKLSTGWRHAARPEQAEAFRPLADRIRQFYEVRTEIGRTAAEAGPAAARQKGFAARDDRLQLHRDLEALGAVYTRQAREAHAAAHAGADVSSTWMIALSAVALLLAAMTALMLWRAVARPLAQITRVTTAVANGETATIPYASRRDEMGALSRSISIFQNAMLSNLQLNRAAAESADAREH